MVEALDNKVAPFLRKAFEMISDEPTEHLISWSTDGTQFTIHHLKDFAANLLPKHFKHSIFSSFVRQLNSYGFRKVDRETWTFAADDFSRDDKPGLMRMKRRSVSKKRGNSEKRSQAEKMPKHENEGANEEKHPYPNLYDGGGGGKQQEWDEMQVDEARDPSEARRNGTGWGNAPSFHAYYQQEIQILRFEVAQLTRRVTSMEYKKELILSQLMHEQPCAMQHEMTAHRALSGEMDARRVMANHEQMMRGMSGEMDARRAAMNEQMMREHGAVPHEMDVRRAAAMNEQMMREQYEMPYAVETHQRNMAGEIEARRMMTSRAMNGSSGEMGYGHLQLLRGSPRFGGSRQVKVLDGIHKFMSENRKASPMEAQMRLGGKPSDTK